MKRESLAASSRWALAVLAVAFAACKGKPDSAPASASMPSAKLSATRKQVAVIPKGTTHEFWKSVHAGANKAGRELGIDIIWKGPVREDDRAEQVRVVEDFVTRGVDGIVLAPLDDKALVPAVKEAAARKIPVVIIDSDIQWQDRVSFVATDNYAAGAAAAKRLGELLSGKGNVAMLRYQEGSASTMQREKGFVETIAKDFATIRVVSDNQYGGATTETAYKTAENILVKLPVLDGVFCPNESTTFGMLRALEDAKRAGKVRFVGFDSSAKLVDALSRGELHGLAIQNPFAMGVGGVGALALVWQGKPVDKRVDTGVVVATPENMKEPAVAALLSPDIEKWLN